ncbi:Acetolactate synthase large subunit thiamine pyrophosphate-requiring enzyme [Halanaeroarchaeum sp. HSR-CO]|uniref:biosynthetic-type acetolactate synthase large subunit n=1 Tax=Halanaeroarchaeum sp. HSR-CO TaxID=2866382 RepID=UPI00217EB086|nr:biosynthetic-type acetolactate synthase large subunit [Halanaeroarchaeum sp. HSR-CO]UWG48745.1 Acetolactate synthase large subunit thiamine pyrophosphate-requiring enzyme [Halanaeroarchaeum sp. HSR-CO]
MTEQHARPRTKESDEKTAAETIEVQNGADSVIATLETAGVKTTFGIQGGAIMPVFDALYHSNIRHISMSHEQGAAHAADAYGIVSGTPGVAIATSGPGATNLVTGLADANMDSDPVIALTGQVASDMVGNDAFQETDTIGITAPVTKGNYFAGDVETVGSDVGEAFALAAEGRQGPTLVDLPKDVTQSPTDLEPVEPRAPDTHEVPTGDADPKTVEAAAEALAAAEKPVILSGGGVIKGDASEEIRTFATEYGIPVVTTMPGLGSFPEDHELALEMGGMHGTGYANLALTHADVLLGVGTRFDDRLTGDVRTFAPGAEVIHVDIDPAEISKNIHADYPLAGDAATVLQQLTAAMPSAPDATEWREQTRQWKAEYPMEYEAPDDRPIKPQFVVEALDEATEDDAIVATGVGQHQMWAAQYWTYREPRTWVSSNGLGTMGYGVPAAIGAKVAAPDQQVVAFEGDGSFLMTGQEISVAVREDLDITVAILNNEYVGMIRQWQDAFYEERRYESEWSWAPDFAKLAEAYGAQGLTAMSYEEAPEVITSALNYDGPSVIDFRIDPEEDVYPMVPSGGANDQFALEEGHLQ